MHYHRNPGNRCTVTGILVDKSSAAALEFGRRSFLVLLVRVTMEGGRVMLWAWVAQLSAVGKLAP